MIVAGDEFEQHPQPDASTVPGAIRLDEPSRSRRPATARPDRRNASSRRCVFSNASAISESWFDAREHAGVTAAKVQVDQQRIVNDAGQGGGQVHAIVVAPTPARLMTAYTRLWNGNRLMDNDAIRSRSESHRW